MARPSDGITESARLAMTPDEAQMAADIAAQLGMSRNRAIRWALRYAWQHATSTTDHRSCTGTHPCASATRGLTAPAGRQRAALQGQTTITHQATMGDET